MYACFKNSVNLFYWYIYQDKDGLGLPAEVFWVVGLLVADGPEKFIFVAAVER